jgi:IS5 family transposase
MRTVLKSLERGSVIEATIGHMNRDQQLDKNFLKSREGDRINALMTAVGYKLAELVGAFGCWRK